MLTPIISGLRLRTYCKSKIFPRQAGRICPRVGISTFYWNLLELIGGFREILAVVGFFQWKATAEQGSIASAMIVWSFGKHSYRRAFACNVSTRIRLRGSQMHIPEQSGHPFCFIADIENPEQTPPLESGISYHR
jgi:hypothetical protein